MTKVPLVPEYETVRRAKPVSAWAVASAVLGVGAILFVLVIPLAVVCGIVGLRQTRGGERRGRGAAITGLAFSIFWALLLAGISPILLGEYRYGRSYRCKQDMRAIGEALFEYAEANRGSFPPNLDAVLKPDVAKFHRSTDAGERSSYIYVGRGVRLDQGDLGETVVMYDPPEKGHSDGINVLVADGHVDFIQAEVVPRMLAGLKAGHNPPWPPSTQP